MDDMNIDTKEALHEPSDTSTESTSELDYGAPSESLQPRRKGGRKPIYATSEERKQRNRQAQAAFRERRTEYIKQLEDSIRVHEANFYRLQAAHRSAADECLMLRYKNSLLEQILLEKGIDVQAELRAHTGSPHLDSSQPPSAPRVMVGGPHHATRSNAASAPKLEPGTTFQSNLSSQAQPGPLLETHPPIAVSQAFENLGRLSSPSSNISMQHHQPQEQCAQCPPHARPHPSLGLSIASNMKPQKHGRSMSTGGLGSGTVSSPYYHSRTFQNHIEQLEQEYEEQEELMEGETQSASPGLYPETFALSSQMAQPQRLPQQAMMSNSVSNDNLQGYLGSILAPFDPTMDTDPFGISKSLRYPTQPFYDNNATG